MSRTYQLLAVIVATAIVATWASISLAQAQGTNREGKTAAAAARPSKSAASKLRSVTGTLEKYDASTNTIVIKSTSGSETVSLSSGSTIRMGAARLTPSDLTAHAGQQVKVRYAESKGQKMAQSVQVEGAATRSARTSTAKK